MFLDAGTLPFTFGQRAHAACRCKSMVQMAGLASFRARKRRSNIYGWIPRTSLLSAGAMTTIRLRPQAAAVLRPQLAPLMVTRACANFSSTLHPSSWIVPPSPHRQKSSRTFFWAAFRLHVSIPAPTPSARRMLALWQLQPCVRTLTEQATASSTSALSLRSP